MSRVLRRLAPAALLLILVSAAANAGEPVRLRVLSYNIHHAEGVDGKLDLERIARVIKSVEPDLVALQEVDWKTTRVKGIDEPVELAMLTGMKAVFGKNIDLQGGEYGNAVLSRLPIRSKRNHLLPRIDESEQRGVLELEIALPGDAGNIKLLATHLDFRRDDQERLASAKAINALVAASDEPAILAGDLNATPDSAVLKLFLSTWTNTSAKPQPTIPVGKPERQIDFVLTRPASRWKTIETKVLDEAVASDHRAILAVIELTTP